MKLTGFLLVLLLCATGRAEDDFNTWTTAGNIGLTVTNFGVLGQGYNIEGQPSCLYRQYSELEFEQVEHFSYGGLWVGGIVSGQPRVSTGVIDGTFGDGEGWEWNNTWARGVTPADDQAALADTILQRSTLPSSPRFSNLAVSHDDLYQITFTDTSTTVPYTTRRIDNHEPLGLKAELNCYAWNYSYADAFVILDLTLTNVSDFSDPQQQGWDIDSIYVGWWIDEAVGNFNLNDYYAPGNGGWSWYDNLAGVVLTNGATPAEGDTISMAVGYDADGDDGFAESILGCRFLGGSAPGVSDPRELKGTANTWRWNTPFNQDFPDLGMPSSDADRYNRMTYTPDLREAVFPYGTTDANSWMMLSSGGCFGTLRPGQSLNAVFAIACGRAAQLTPTQQASPAPDVLHYRAANLVASTDWAKIAWDGEDRNGNGVLDPGEDLIANGVLDRYLLPQPPPGPRTHLEVADHAITLYWDNSPELFIDPISGEADFEGYRVYGSPRTEGIQQDKTLLLELDLINEIWPNTGLAEVTLADSVQYDGHWFHYALHLENLLNGQPRGNWVAVSAFDRGNADNNLPSLESDYKVNRAYYYPGALPDDRAAGGPDRAPGVYPNPYRGHASWDGTGAYERLIWFTNLPPRCQIQIFTISGDLVAELDHDASTYQGDNVALIRQTREQLAGQDTPFIFSGGEHAWDLVTKHNQAIATGLYLFSVEDLATGSVEVGKFAVIK
ncbi:MAG: hypothetical protein H6678_09600 [Candidatus Delongbacteria bacterium]|nr:hypothetical protein [Candidatus Cloacimonadota bacterium]MCB9474052.1 hypothetical protein [Candidatus Delongbacteria bacterium]